MRPYLAILAVSAALAGPALAAPGAKMDGDDEAIATAQARPTAQALSAAAAQAPPAPPAAAAGRPATTQEQIAAFIAANPNPEVEDAPRGLVPAGDDRDEDGRRKVHGSMGVSVGTGGYRSAYASALIPVGENTTVGVAFSQTDFGKHGGWAYADPYGYGPGYGYGGPWRTRGGERQSLGLSVMSGLGGRDDTPEGCAPGFRADGRYIEPTWVEGMRDGARPCAAAAPSR